MEALRRIKIAIVLSLAFLAAILAVKTVKAEDGTIYRLATLKGIEENVVIYETLDGNLYEAIAAYPEEHQLDELMVLVMYDNGTPKNIYDDEIMDAIQLN